MPKRTDIRSILIIGAGPIVIGQACEFDYSGAQACKALREEGYRVILVNSNPATIMTDPEMADATYIEPITPEIVAKIIEKERPDALLPTMGGQTGLNTALAVADMGVLEKYGVELIGAKREAIEMAEDRKLFREAMDRIGLENPKATIANSMEEAMAAIEHVGLPAIIRPAFTLGGTGGGVAYNREDYEHICGTGLDASPVGQILIDESLLGWKEFEMEVVRDRADNCIIVCSIENVDPMGVHTGDSITVAPALTLTDKEYQMMRNASIAVLREIGVETGGSNVQFAVEPETGRMVVIEMNPRVSRSSALASKATGFPIAKIAAKLAVGYTLDELDNDITKVTPASFEPTIDYVVTKIPRFAFEKFPGSEPLLTTAMKSVGEAMAIGRTFHESVQKALCSMETGLTGFDEIDIPGAPDKAAVMKALSIQTPDRLRLTAQAMRHGLTDDEIHAVTRFDPWFLARIREIVEMEDALRETGLPRDAAGLRRLKMFGFSDARLATLTARTETNVRAERQRLGVRPVFKRIDTCAAEFEAQTPYMYSTYEHDAMGYVECEARPSGPREGRDPRRRPQPHRPGHRVRLLLLPRLLLAVEGRLRDHHDQLQPRDGLHRLRHLRPALFRAAHPRDRARDPPRRAGERHPEGRHRPVRRPDAAQARQRPARCRHPDPRHLARRHRPRRGPRALPAASPPPRAETARQRPRPLRGGGPARRREDRLSAGDPPLLRAGRPRHGDRPRRCRPQALHHRGRARLRRRSRAARQLPDRRRRGRCRRDLRRRGRPRRRHHGAYRGSRRAFRRQRLRPAALFALQGDDRRASRSRPARWPSASTCAG